MRAAPAGLWSYFSKLRTVVAFTHFSDADDDAAAAAAPGDDRAPNPPPRLLPPLVTAPAGLFSPADVSGAF